MTEFRPLPTDLSVDHKSLLFHEPEIPGIKQNSTCPIHTSEISTTSDEPAIIPSTTTESPSPVKKAGTINPGTKSFRNILFCPLANPNSLLPQLSYSNGIDVPLHIPSFTTIQMSSLRESPCLKKTTELHHRFKRLSNTLRFSCQGPALLDHVSQNTGLIHLAYPYHHTCNVTSICPSAPQTKLTRRIPSNDCLFSVHASAARNGPISPSFLNGHHLLFFILSHIFPPRTSGSISQHNEECRLSSAHFTFSYFAVLPSASTKTSLLPSDCSPIPTTLDCFCTTSLSLKLPESLRLGGEVDLFRLN